MGRLSDDSVTPLAGTSVALPSGGSTGQVLAKASSADGDAVWEDASGASASVHIAPADEPPTGSVGALWVVYDPPSTPFGARVALTSSTADPGTFEGWAYLITGAGASDYNPDEYDTAAGLSGAGYDYHRTPGDGTGVVGDYAIFTWNKTNQPAPPTYHGGAFSPFVNVGELRWWNDTAEEWKPVASADRVVAEVVGYASQAASGGLTATNVQAALDELGLALQVARGRLDALENP